MEEGAAGRHVGHTDRHEDPGEASELYSKQLYGY